MTPPDCPSASLRLQIDRQALAANWRALDRLSGNAQAGAAVKADAYGLGAVHAATVLREAGARQFFVAHCGEASELLPHIPAQEISVLHGPIDAQQAQFFKTAGVRPVVNSVQQARLWLDVGGGACDLMIDTGMNRLGICPGDYADETVAQLEVESLLSHLVSADEDGPLSEKQLRLFRDAAAVIPAKRRSLANSAGIALGADYHFDLTRPGLALYGGVPRPELADVIQQVAYPQVRVIQTRCVQQGDTVGYNAMFTAPHAMRTATLSLGYADGFLRSWPQGTAFRFGDHSLPLIGRISMDMVILDCTKVPDLAAGDWVDVPYDLTQASSSGLSPYEMLTLLGRRFDRVLV